MMPKLSLRSAGATFLDRKRRIQELSRAVGRAAREMPEIRRVILFGSLAHGTATPRSDADLIVVVAHSPQRHCRDRIPGVLEALGELPCPVDLFVLTIDELQRARQRGLPLAQEGLDCGLEIYPRATDPSAAGARCAKLPTGHGEHKARFDMRKSQISKAVPGFQSSTSAADERNGNSPRADENLA